MELVGMDVVKPDAGTKFHIAVDRPRKYYILILWLEIVRMDEIHIRTVFDPFKRG